MNYPSNKEVKKENPETHENNPHNVKPADIAPEEVFPAVPADVKVIKIDREEEKVDNIIKLSQKYSFEGEIIEQIDLTGLEDVTALQMQKAESKYRKITKNVSSTPELTLDYALAMANTLTGLPIEFLQRMSGKDATKIKSRVINFLYSEE